MYEDQQNNDPARGGITYAVLSDDELAKIPIGDLGAKDSIMLCWITAPKIESGLQLMRLWGYRPTTAALVWIKLNPSSRGAFENEQLLDPDYKLRKVTILDKGVYSGMGRYTNANAEFLWLGKRGKGLPRIEKNVKQIMFAPRGKHSRKPWETYSRIDRLFGTDIRRVELFARPPVPENWVATGYEFDGRDIRDFIYDPLRKNDEAINQPEEVGARELE